MRVAPSWSRRSLIAALPLIGSQTVVRYAESDGCGHVTYVDIPVFPVRPPSDTATAAVTSRSAAASRAGDASTSARADRSGLTIRERTTPREPADEPTMRFRNASEGTRRLRPSDANGRGTATEPAARMRPSESHVAEPRPWRELQRSSPAVPPAARPTESSRVIKPAS